MCGFHASSHNISRTELFLIYLAWWMQGTSNFLKFLLILGNSTCSQLISTLSVGGPVLKDESPKTNSHVLLSIKKNNKVGPKFPIRRKSHGVVGHDFL
jgi:hypothetical protein